MMTGYRDIEVVAAIIRRGNQLFATQRGYGEWKDFWEWPGGKVEVGERPEQALMREIREELDTETAWTASCRLLNGTIPDSIWSFAVTNAPSAPDPCI